eukprot:g2118.t1
MPHSVHHDKETLILPFDDTIRNKGIVLMPEPLECSDIPVPADFFHDVLKSYPKVSFLYHVAGAGWDAGSAAGATLGTTVGVFKGGMVHMGGKVALFGGCAGMLFGSAMLAQGLYTGKARNSAEQSRAEQSRADQSRSDHVMSHHVTSYHIISHIMSHHIISYHIISYHIISHHQIRSYQIISYISSAQL